MNEENFTYLPVTPESSCKTALHPRGFDEITPHTTYDIHFIINLLGQMEGMFNNGKFSPSNTLLTMRESCKSLRVKLEMERDFSKNNAVKSYRCDKCGEMYFVPKFNQDVCPHCEENKNIPRISNF